MSLELQAEVLALFHLGIIHCLTLLRMEETFHVSLPLLLLLDMACLNKDPTMSPSSMVWCTDLPMG